MSRSVVLWWVLAVKSGLVFVGRVGLRRVMLSCGCHVGSRYISSCRVVFRYVMAVMLGSVALCWVRLRSVQAVVFDQV